MAANGQEPPRLQLFVGAENRQSSVTMDARLVNACLERNEVGEIWVRKRPGTRLLQAPPTGIHFGTGLYADFNQLVYVVDNQMYLYGGLSPVGSLNARALGITRYSFTGCALSGFPYSINGGGTPNYYTPGGAFGSATDSTTGLPIQCNGASGTVYLDGYYYVPNRPGAYIQGSIATLNHPDQFNPLNTMQAYNLPGAGVFLGRQGSYVVYFKTSSIEFFYNAGTTPAPLAPYPGSALSFGCAAASSVRQLQGVYYYMSWSADSGYSVRSLTQLADKKISTPAIDRLLGLLTNVGAADVPYTHSLAFSFGGHSYYVLTLPDLNLSLVYDATTQMWAQWTDASGNYFPFVDACFFRGQVILQSLSGGLYVWDESLSQDDGQPIPTDIYTPAWDGGTRLTKDVLSIYIHADQTPGCILKVRYNDQDYAADGWSQFQQVELGQPWTFMDSGGSTRARAYHLRHDNNTFFRIKAVEIHAHVGSI